MPPRIPDDKRAQILTDIQAGEKSRGQIARDHHVSTTTVSQIAKENGLADPFSREQTKNATKAKEIDNKALRATTSRRFLDKANDLLDQMDQPHVVFNIGGKDNIYTDHLMDRPPTGDLRNLMISAATAFDKHLKAESHDSDTQGLSAVDSWLRDIMGG